MTRSLNIALAWQFLHCYGAQKALLQFPRLPFEKPSEWDYADALIARAFFKLPWYPGSLGLSALQEYFRQLQGLPEFTKLGGPEASLHLR